MKKRLNIKRVVGVAVLGGIAIGLVLPTAIDLVLDVVAMLLDGAITDIENEYNETFFSSSKLD